MRRSNSFQRRGRKSNLSFASMLQLRSSCFQSLPEKEIDPESRDANHFGQERELTVVSSGISLSPFFIFFSCPVFA